MVLSCGDDGSVRGWKWKEFAESEVSLRLQEDHAQPLLEFTNPQHKKRAHSLTSKFELWTKSSSKRVDFSVNPWFVFFGDTSTNNTASSDSSNVERDEVDKDQHLRSSSSTGSNLMYFVT